MANVVIIGSGPAGVSAALYTARAGVDTTVLTKGPGALARSEGIENYYGVPGNITGAELERRGIEGAREVGVKFVETEAVGLTFTDKLTVETLNGDYPADAVILATGASRTAPPVPGLAALEGHGVSYCATCDAFFYRGKHVAVMGSGEYALHEASALLPLAASVTLLTGGAQLTAEFPRRDCRPHREGGGHPGRRKGHRRPSGRRRGTAHGRRIHRPGCGRQHRPGPEDGGRGGRQQDCGGCQHDDHHPRPVRRRRLHRRPAAGGQGGV